MRANGLRILFLTAAACSGATDLGPEGLVGDWSFDITTRYSNFVPDTSTSGLAHEGMARSFGMVILVQRDESSYTYGSAGRGTYLWADSVLNTTAVRDSAGPIQYPNPALGFPPLVKVRNDTIFNLYTMPLPPALRVSRNVITGTFGLEGQTCKDVPNGSRLSCGALKKDSFLNLRAPAASSAC